MIPWHFYLLWPGKLFVHLGSLYTLCHWRYSLGWKIFCCCCSMEHKQLVCPSLPSLSFSFSLFPSLNFPPSPSPSTYPQGSPSPLIQLWSGECCELPQQIWLEPGQTTVSHRDVEIFFHHQRAHKRTHNNYASNTLNYRFPSFGGYWKCICLAGDRGA